MHGLKQLLIGCLTILMAGCAARQPPHIYTGLPDLPVLAECFYEPYLDCLGKLLAAKGGPEIDVIIGGLDDKTRPPNALEPGFIPYSGIQMTRTGLARLAPRVIASTPTAVTATRRVVLIKGAFTELDRTILSRAAGFGIRIALQRLFGMEVSYDADHTFDIMTLDIELARPDGRQLPGLATMLSVMVDTKTQDAFLLAEDDKGSVAASAAGKIKAVGRYHASARLLLYAGLYWLFSRYFQVNGQACIDAPKTDVEALRTLSRTYQEMGEPARIEAIQRLLQDQGYFVGEIDRKLGPQTRRAIRKFQGALGDPPTGEISAHLYIQLQTQAGRTRPDGSNAARQ
jgi:hypothetical protein